MPFLEKDGRSAFVFSCSIGLEDAAFVEASFCREIVAGSATDQAWRWVI